MQLSRRTATTQPTARRRRRIARGAATLAAGSLLLVGCAQGDAGAGATADDDGGGEGGEATIRFAWWGSDHYHQMYQEVADAFMAEHPDITIVPEFTDWGGYWDKLATTVAAGDTPDVLMQEQRYLREYAERGVLADLSDAVDTSAMDEALVATGEVDDGLYAIPTGTNVFSIVANPAVFEQAGVEMPDDTTWTWDDFHDVATQVGAAGDDLWGKQDWGSNDAGLNIFARQHGEQLFTEDGELGVSKETIAEWWQMSLDLQESGGQPPASASSEMLNMGPEQSLVATNRGATMAEWTNQLTAIANAAGHELELLRWPGESSGERTGMYYKPALYASMSATSEHPEEAAMFIDFMLNSETAGDIIMADLGLPVNLETRERVVAELPETDKQSAEFVADLEDEIVDSPPVPPVGAGEMAAILGRLNDEVLFERLTPEDAAERFISEVEAIIGG
ncbi:extracellular solute-binding protein [Actinotalea ferrariae]|uniref:ABC transporter substrate-binding protein n=1 Tax=Actinotalea ferrariae TaxID=1386098 RepID=UPI001C8CC281|nr:extracellular solute-binding protein [Actinotalea ferrariae]MBX9244985.1 extracellular solute-binding protein [Actinotalea ferrariae]